MKATLVAAVEWEGVYLDGVLLFEDHSLSAYELFRILGNKSNTPITSFEIVRADDEWLVEHGYLPENLKDVKTK